MADIFLSHASADREVAEMICSALENRRHTCWIAVRDVRPGENYMEAIVHALRDCKVMLLVFFRSANASKEITKELSLASKYKKYVVPARVEDVLPTEAFEYALADRQWIDLFRDWDRRVTELSDLLLERTQSKLNKSDLEDKAITDDKFKWLYTNLRERFSPDRFDISMVLGCMGIDPNPHATLSLTHVTQHYSVDADFEKKPGGIHVKLDHSDMGGYERLYYFNNGKWEYTPIRNWGASGP